MIDDHYRALGVTRIASRDEIHKAFLRLAGRYNPNRNKEPGAAARLVAVTEAHDVLFDPARRTAYDFDVWRSPAKLRANRTCGSADVAGSSEIGPRLSTRATDTLMARG